MKSENIDEKFLALEETNENLLLENKKLKKLLKKVMEELQNDL